MSALRILILGGYGTFGGRLAQLLSEEGRLTLLIAGRDVCKANAFCAKLAGNAASIAVRFDRDADVDVQLKALSPDVVVDASGPFQAYGDDPYRVVRACIALGCNYMDLADGSDFVEGIARFDTEAREKGIFVLSGVSTCPVLTAAAARSLSEGLATVSSITGGIAPSPYAGVGRNVVEAIASYAGRDVEVIREGGPATGRGIGETRRFTIAPPGYLPLNSTLFSLVDVPDLKVLPRLWPDLRSVWFGAGPTPESLHCGLIAMAGLVRLRVLKSLLPLAPSFHAAINRLRWGEHRGGMFVEVNGTGCNGTEQVHSWHLVAERDRGPFIPCMAVDAVIRLLLDGRRPLLGACSAESELDLTDYEPGFARGGIVTGCRRDMPEHLPLYQRILGDAWLALPEQIRAMHMPGEAMVAEGTAEVERGRGVLSAIVAALIGFPKAGPNVPISVSFVRRGSGEIWQRTFGRRSFGSVQTEGKGRDRHLVCERFGPITVSLAVVLEGERLRLVVRRWRFLGVPMPLRLAPGGDAFESVEDGRFRFHVEIAHPLTGLIVRYRGSLSPVA